MLHLARKKGQLTRDDDPLYDSRLVIGMKAGLTHGSLLCMHLHLHINGLRGYLFAGLVALKTAH